MSSDTRLKEMLLADFGVDLPISGGIGNSRDAPIVIHYQQPNDYVAVEYAVLRLLGIGRGIEWKFLQNTMFPHGERRLEQMKIEAVWEEGSDRITQIENFYFDITDCFGKR